MQQSVQLFCEMKPSADLDELQQRMSSVLEILL